MTSDQTTSDPTTSHPTTSDSVAADPPPPAVWPCLNYRDARPAIAQLVDVFGFVERAAYADAGDDTVVHHAELRWPEGGGVMLGTADRPDSEFSQMPTGAASTYVVTDDPAAVHGRCVAAGLEVVRELREEDYGSLGFSVRDREGNIWSFGTHRGD